MGELSKYFWKASVHDGRSWKLLIYDVVAIDKRKLDKMMLDQYGRKIEYMRISVTQKCNLKCIYCDPDGDLGNNGEVDIREALDLKPENFNRIVSQIIMEKPRGHHFGEGFSSTRRMNRIGG